MPKTRNASRRRRSTGGSSRRAPVISVGLVSVGVVTYVALLLARRHDAPPASAPPLSGRRSCLLVVVRSVGTRSPNSARRPAGRSDTRPESRAGWRAAARRHAAGGGGGQPPLALPLARHAGRFDLARLDGWPRRCRPGGRFPRCA